MGRTRVRRQGHQRGRRPLVPGSMSRIGPGPAPPTRPHSWFTYRAVFVRRLPGAGMKPSGNGGGPVLTPVECIVRPLSIPKAARGPAYFRSKVACQSRAPHEWRGDAGAHGPRPRSWRGQTAPRADPDVRRDRTRTDRMRRPGARRHALPGRGIMIGPSPTVGRQPVRIGREGTREPWVGAAPGGPRRAMPRRGTPGSHGGHQSEDPVVVLVAL
jgi:hypothetical protein